MAPGDAPVAARRRRLLVTGATGFVGRHLLAHLPESWEATALVRAGSEGRVSGVAAVHYPPLEGELPPELRQPFDALIHLAGNASHVLAESRPWDDLIATGVTAASVLGRVQAGRIVVLSSAAVYAGLVGLVSPACRVRPPMAYALSKLYVEGLAEAAVAAGRAQSSLVLRLYNAFGPGERATRLVPRVVQAARAGDVFTITGDPESLSDPVHIDHVVEALLAAAELEVSGILDLCGGDPVPLKRQVERIAQAMGYQPPSVVVSPRPGEQPIRFFSNPRPLQEALDVTPPEPFEVSVRRYGVAAAMTAS